MVDLRYHLATIVGLFLALGLGMLIGMQLAEQGAVAEERLRLAERIEEGLERIRAENRRLSQDVLQLQEQVESERRFAAMAVAAVVGEALSGHRVALYSADVAQPEVQRVAWVLQLAGAEVIEYARPAPPAPEELSPPYVVIWSDAWGKPPAGALWPPGGVVAHAPSHAAENGADSGVALELVSVGTPSGLLQVVQALAAPPAGTGVEGESGS